MSDAPKTTDWFLMSLGFICLGMAWAAALDWCFPQGNAGQAALASLVAAVVNFGLARFG